MATETQLLSEELLTDTAEVSVTRSWSNAAEQAGSSLHVQFRDPGTLGLAENCDYAQSSTSPFTGSWPGRSARPGTGRTGPTLDASPCTAPREPIRGSRPSVVGASAQPFGTFLEGSKRPGVAGPQGGADTATSAEVSGDSQQAGPSPGLSCFIRRGVQADLARLPPSGL